VSTSKKSSHILDEAGLLAKAPKAKTAGAFGLPSERVAAQVARGLALAALSLLRILLELLDTSLFDLAHQLATAKEIWVKEGSQLAEHDIKLVVSGVSERDGCPRRHQVSPPS
jgi:hypothetical protein